MKQKFHKAGKLLKFKSKRQFNEKEFKENMLHIVID